MNERDKRRILERRALFVGSSLALLSCGPKPPAETPAGASTAVSVPESPPTASTEEVGVVEAPPERQPRSEPDFEVPEGVSERAREYYDHLFKSVRTQLETLDAAERKLPKPCDVTVPGCEAAFRGVADVLLDFEQSQRFSYFCPGSSAEAKEFAKAADRLRQQVTERHGELTKLIVAAMSGKGIDADKEWERIRQEAYAARPHPCLSFACADW
ncbi:MAG: hypothetical protein R3B13_12290 [Polyangiaceae bacterium]